MAAILKNIKLDNSTTIWPISVKFGTPMCFPNPTAYWKF